MTTQEFFNFFTGLKPEYAKDSREQFYFEALLEAWKGLGFTSPNPSVGAILIGADNKVLARAFHKQAGHPHAEIEILHQLAPVQRLGEGPWTLEPSHAEQVKNTTLYVTLEPCAHQGRTPSCAKTLAQLPFKKVGALLKDPNPLVAGQGFKILQDAGVQVECLEDISPQHELVLAAKKIHQFFLNGTLNQAAPFYTLKVATSLDGYLGLKNGESKWITSEPARLYARHLRGTHDAIMVGKGTVLTDDPRLDFRETVFDGAKKSRLIIWDSGGEVLGHPDLQIFKCHDHENIIVVTDKIVQAEAISKKLMDVKTLLLPSDPNQAASEFNIKIKQMGIHSLWVEGGAKLISYCLSQQLANSLMLFQAPKLLGGQNGRSWTEALRVESLDQALFLKINQVTPVGPDICIQAYFEKP